MLQLELRARTIYLTTDDRAEMLRAIHFLTEELRKMEDLNKMQRTIYVTQSPKTVETP